MCSLCSQSRYVHSEAKYLFRQSSCQFCLTPYVNVFKNHMLHSSPWCWKTTLWGKRQTKWQVPQLSPPPFFLIASILVNSPFSCLKYWTYTRTHLVTQNKVVFVATTYCILWFLVGHKRSWFHFPRCLPWRAQKKQTLSAEASDKRHWMTHYGGRWMENSAVAGTRQTPAAAMLCALRGSLLAPYPKQGHGWRRTRCGHWLMVHKELLGVWSKAAPWHHLPDGSLINTHPLERHRSIWTERSSVWA